MRNYGHNKTKIEAEQLENLFAEGLTQAQIAEKLGMRFQNLSRKINNSMTLSDARERGIQRAKEKNNR